MVSPPLCLWLLYHIFVSKMNLFYLLLPARLKVVAWAVVEGFQREVTLFNEGVVENCARSQKEDSSRKGARNKNSHREGNVYNLLTSISSVPTMCQALYGLRLRMMRRPSTCPQDADIHGQTHFSHCPELIDHNKFN